MPMFGVKHPPVEAVQVLPELHDAMTALLAKSAECEVLNIYGDDGQWQVTIRTPLGVMFAQKGDWLVLDSQNELTLLGDTLFSFVYEPMD